MSNHLLGCMLVNGRFTGVSVIVSSFGSAEIHNFRRLYGIVAASTFVSTKTTIT